LSTLRIGDWIITYTESFKPREIVLEVSTRCNLQCIHCFRYAVQGFEYRDLDFESYKKIVDNAVESGVKKIVFTGWGEPTINPFILDMLEYAKKHGLYTVLNTNGFLLREIASDIVEVGVDELYVSIDAVDIELYEKIRRLGDLSIVSQGLKTLFEYKEKNGSRKPLVKTIYTINKLNVGSIEKILDYAVEAGIQEVYLSLYIPYEGGARGIECESSECLSILRKQLEKIAVRAINMPVKIWSPNTSSYTSRQCPFAFNKALFIRSDGKITPCIYMAYSWTTIYNGVKRRIQEYIIGDALREKIIDVWRRNKDLYFKLFFNYMPSCIDCELVKYCSYTLSTDTDCWGNKPNCSHCPYHYKSSYCPI